MPVRLKLKISVTSEPIDFENVAIGPSVVLSYFLEDGTLQTRKIPPKNIIFSYGERKQIRGVESPEDLILLTEMF